MLMLARHIGPRIPCEIREMKFEHFSENHFDIVQGKTGPHRVPLMLVLRPHFELVRANAKSSQEYVFEKYRKHANVGKVLTGAIKASSEKPWPKIFNNLRSSCITDKEREGLPESTMNLFFGNSFRVRTKNYVQKLRNEELAALCGNLISTETTIESPAENIIRYDNHLLNMSPENHFALTNEQDFEWPSDDNDEWPENDEEYFDFKEQYSNNTKILSGDFSSIETVKTIIFAEALADMDADFLQYFHKLYGDNAGLEELIHLHVSHGFTFTCAKDGLAANIVKMYARPEKRRDNLDNEIADLDTKKPRVRG